MYVCMCICAELITCPVESYRLWFVVCDIETSRMRPWPVFRRSARRRYIASIHMLAYVPS